MVRRTTDECMIRAVVGTKKLGSGLPRPGRLPGLDSTDISAITQGGFVKHVALITSLLLLSVTALGQTYSNANLNGNYSFNFGSPQNYSWSKTFTRPTQSQITYTVNGSQTGMNVTLGVVAFDVIGGLS